MAEGDGRVPHSAAAEGVNLLTSHRQVKLSGSRTISGHRSGKGSLPKGQPADCRINHSTVSSR